MRKKQYFFGWLNMNIICVMISISIIEIAIIPDGVSQTVQNHILDNWIFLAKLRDSLLSVCPAWERPDPSNVIYILKSEFLLIPNIE